jgi:glucose/arabinose dehydrogenase
VVSGLVNPIQITNAGDGSGRLFVVEQRGRIRIVKDGELAETSFLDIHDRVSCCNERGLLSVAFPASFATSGSFYVNYTDLAGDTVVARFQAPAGTPDIADPGSGKVLLTIPQPYSNHNGGQIAFSPHDGYLYVGMGDGGDAGDPQNNGQSPGSLLGKMLRIDVESGAAPYAVPPSNPFTQTAAYRGEIWAVGLRNPWRFSFDRDTGDLYIGDVGQYSWEEVDYQPAASAGGENYGWRRMEGMHCFKPADCDPTGLTLPVTEYGHGLGCAVTGGYVYRGQEADDLRGWYLYGDYCSGRIWGLKKNESGWQSEELLRQPILISSFGEDEAGELYVADHRGGVVYQVTLRYEQWLPAILRTTSTPSMAACAAVAPNAPGWCYWPG